MARGNALSTESLAQVRAQCVPNVLSNEVPDANRGPWVGGKDTGYSWIFDLTLCLGCSGPGSAAATALDEHRLPRSATAGGHRSVPRSDHDHGFDLRLQDRSRSRIGVADPHCYPEVAPRGNRRPPSLLRPGHLLVGPTGLGQALIRGERADGAWLISRISTSVPKAQYVLSAALHDRCVNAGRILTLASGRVQGPSARSAADCGIGYRWRRPVG